jgi:hypothetical protein
VIATGFGADGDLNGFNALMFKVLKWFLPGPDRGASTSVYLASSPEVAQTSGLYFSNSKAVEPSNLAKDDALARGLWEASEALVAAVPRTT